MSPLSVGLKFQQGRLPALIQTLDPPDSARFYNSSDSLWRHAISKPCGSEEPIPPVIRLPPAGDLIRLTKDLANYCVVSMFLWCHQ